MKPYFNPDKVETYRQLKHALEQMNDEQLDCNISVHALGSDEFFPGSLMIVRSTELDTDVLDENHPVICYED